MSSDSEFCSDDSVDYYEEDVCPSQNNKRPHEEMSKLNDLMF